jgi:hypothetical protein
VTFDFDRLGAMACHGSDFNLGWVYGFSATASTHIAFWGFIFSNALWVVWGWHTNAFGLVVLECILLGMNACGFRKNQRASQALR